MKEKHIANSGHRQRFVSRGPDSLDHSTGEEDAVGCAERRLIEPCDADSCADYAEETGDEELRAFTVFLGEDGDEGTVLVSTNPSRSIQ